MTASAPPVSFAPASVSLDSLEAPGGGTVRPWPKILSALEPLEAGS